MWRAFTSLLLTFAALAWAIISLALCFFYASTFWRDLFGRSGAFYGALVAFILCLTGARLMLRLADQLLEPYSGPFDGSVYASAPRDAFYRDWRRYAADIVRNRRYALYARTRQWDKVAALEAEEAAHRAAAPAEASSGAPSGTAVGPEARAGLERAWAPRRTSMAGTLAPDEVRRASRRMAGMASEPASRAAFWQALDDGEQVSSFGFRVPSGATQALSTRNPKPETR